MRPIIYPYKMNSKSGRTLADILSTIRVWPDRKYRVKPNHVVINWGSSKLPNWMLPTFNPVQIVNKPWDVHVAANKLAAFIVMGDEGVIVPRFTTNVLEAIEWERPFMIRTKLTGHSGAGCVYADPTRGSIHVPEDTKLLVEYIKKKDEYRVHVFRGQIIDVQQKKKRKDTDVDFKIRNHANGWVYAREGVNPPDAVLGEAFAAIEAIGLDFGAADVIWNEYYQTAYVLEVNTAPGLYGKTAAAYADAVLDWCRNV